VAQSCQAFFTVRKASKN